MLGPDPMGGYLADRDLAVNWDGQGCPCARGVYQPNKTERKKENTLMEVKERKKTDNPREVTIAENFFIHGPPLPVPRFASLSVDVASTAAADGTRGDNALRRV